MKINNLPTYIYVDVSNIRLACKRSCGFNLDFTKLYEYFKGKYINLKEVYYYEGIASNDKKREKDFRYLRDKVGYKVRPLKRRRYKDPPRYANFNCEKCGAPNSVMVAAGTTKLKSNVDVYLASDMIELAATHAESVHIILVSCDGDYAEAIKTIIRLNLKAHVSILATPMKRKNNCLSQRLQAFSNRKFKRTSLINIETIKDYIS